MNIVIDSNAAVDIEKIDGENVFKVSCGGISILVPGVYEKMLYGLWNRSEAVRAETAKRIEELAKDGKLDDPFKKGDPVRAKGMLRRLCAKTLGRSVVMLIGLSGTIRISELCSS